MLWRTSLGWKNNSWDLKIIAVDSHWRWPLERVLELLSWWFSLAPKHASLTLLVQRSWGRRSVCFGSSNPWKGGKAEGADCGGSGDDWLAFMRLLGHVIALGILKRKVVWRQQCQPGSPSLYLNPCSQRAACISHNCSPLTLNSTFSEPVLCISPRSIQVEIDACLLLPLGPFPFRKCLPSASPVWEGKLLCP